MPAKKPRRTSDRILEVTLAMFNRFGEPNVSTSQLCGELGISPGNLFYHHPTRDALVMGLFAQYQAALLNTLAAHAPALPSPEPAFEPWLAGGSDALNRLAWLCHDLALTAWTFRFLFRDLNDLVSRHRVLEESLPQLLRQQAAALTVLVQQQTWQPQRVPDEVTLKVVIGPMLAILTGSMGLDGVMDPRERLRDQAQKLIHRNTGLALALIRPALAEPDQSLLAAHLAQSDSLGQDPWWLGPPDG